MKYFVWASMWYTQWQNEVYFPSAIRILMFLLVKSRRPSFMDGTCTCAVWMNLVATDCKSNRKEIRDGQTGSEKNLTHTISKVEPTVSHCYPYSFSTGNRTELQGCLWVLIYHHHQASSDFSISQTVHYHRGLLQTNVHPRLKQQLLFG